MLSIMYSKMAGMDRANLDCMFWVVLCLSYAMIPRSSLYSRRPLSNDALTSPVRIFIT